MKKRRAFHSKKNYYPTKKNYVKQAGNDRVLGKPANLVLQRRYECQFVEEIELCTRTGANHLEIVRRGENARSEGRSPKWDDPKNPGTGASDIIRTQGFNLSGHLADGRIPRGNHGKSDLALFGPS